MYLGYFLEGAQLYTTGVCLSYAEALRETAQLLADLEDLPTQPPANERSLQAFVLQIARHPIAAAGVQEVELGWELLCLFRRLLCLETRQEALAELQAILDKHEGIDNEHQRLQRWAEREASWR